MRSLHTPQQETNVAYNPGVTFRGGEFIAQGISQAGNALADGLQRYAQNREESAALDMSFQTRAQPLLEEMQKFSDKNGEVSPAASLVDKGADWHKFSSSQKKAFLADVVIMGDKQDRARRQQQEDDFRKAAQQFQQDQLTATERHRRVVEEQGAANALQSARNQNLDNLRLDERLGMDRQNFTNLQEARRAKLESDALMAGNLAEFQRLAAEPTGPSRMGGDAAAALLSQPGTRLPDFSAYGPRDIQLTQQPLSTERIAQLGTQTGAWQHPQFDNLAKLYQGKIGASANNKPAEYTDSLGKVWIYNPVSGNYQRLGVTGYEQAMDSDGNPVAGLATLNGKVVKMPTAKELGLTPARNPETGAVIPGYYFDGTGKLHDLQNMMEKLDSTSGTARPPTARGDRRGENGYTVGRVYSGKRYLGGSPNEAGNWEEAR